MSQPWVLWLSIILIIIGIIMIVIGVILREQDRNAGKSSSWWVWFLIYGGIVLGVIGIILLIVYFVV